MSVPSIASIKAQLRNLSLAKVQGYAKKALACHSPEEVRALPLPA
jgi:phosphoenolpyruvate-protein kinase (PTS system EI component)